MKLQANELPLMKNQTRRKATPKIAPLVVLALFLLTIIPIYYPLLRYPNKNSSQPSSSSRISFEASVTHAHLSGPICRDDLSQENGRCPHQDVEKPPVISTQDSVTTDHGRDVEEPHAQSDPERDVETKPIERGNNSVTANDRDVETLLRNHDPGRDVETKPTMIDMVTAHDGDDTVVETLSRKQNPGRDVVETKPTLRKSDSVTAAHPDRDAEELPTGDLATAHDSDETVVETLPRKQNPGRDVETKPTLRKSDSVTTYPDKDSDELPVGDLETAHDGDERVMETLPRKQKPSRDVETKPTVRKSDSVTAHDSDDKAVRKQNPGRDVDGLPTGDSVTARSGKDAERVAASSNRDSAALPGRGVKKTRGRTSNRERVTMHRRRDVGRSSTAASNSSNMVPRNVAESEKCDIFSGSWVPDPEGPYYTNMTCGTIQEHQNCIKFGRPDRQYLKWRWKPEGCELPIFDPYQFLELMRGKSLAFVGDSVARNHMQSLICLLSRVEEPEDVSEVPYGSQFKRYEYRNHNFTIEIFWSPYLVRTTQTDPTDPTQSRPFNLFLDEFDEQWTSKIEPFDYVIISAGHWFFRPTMFYVEGRVAGCLYCPQSNITHLTTYFSYRRAFRTAFRAINSLENYKGITFLRTFAPSHFEGGYWDKGGDCVRKRPFMNNETRLEGYNLELYLIQVQELKIAERLGRRRGLKFRLFDVTQAMLMRPDGHPSKYGHWPQTKVSLANDCVHWCLPGPVDAWNDFFLELLKREEGLELV